MDTNVSTVYSSPKRNIIQSEEYETITDLRAFVLVHHTAIGLPHVVTQITPAGQQPLTCVSPYEGNSRCQKTKSYKSVYCR